jgi:transcriptional regulator with XRE-family HTH domain
MALGNQVKKYRSMLGWTLEQLEQFSGVATGTINALENRDSVRSVYTQQLATAMGLTVEQLSDESNTYTPDLHKVKEDTKTYNVQKSEATLRSMTLGQALMVLAHQMNGLDPPLQAAIGALVSGMCTNPANADTAASQITALLEIQGKLQAQKTTNHQAA